MPQLKIALEIANMIKDENIRGKEKIPTSEAFFRKAAQALSISEEEIGQYLKQLEETHYIFVINVVHADASLFVQEVKAYIFAEQSILNELKHYSESSLIQKYEATFYKRKSSFQIIRELKGREKEYNNTDLGRSLNEAIAIEDLSKMISTNGFEYTDSRKKEKLFKLYRERHNDDFDEESEEQQYQEFNKKKKDNTNSKWTKLTGQFSVEFLVRIHFRKYEFDIVKKLIMTGKITRLNDFVFIRNTLKSMEAKVEYDTILKYHLEQMIELRRIAQAKINIIRKSETMDSQA
ncbi:MAG: hypothetical protein AAF518_10405 [Spirochaetota bacterium]